MENITNNEERLRQVFDVCDPQNNGYITVEKFISLAKDHFGADEEGEELDQIIEVLDPQRDGKIHFQDFCVGVQKVFELNEALQSPSIGTGQKFGSIDTLVHQTHSSQETLVDEDANSSGTHETSEVSTYNEYDMMTDDDSPQAANNDHLIPSINYPNLHTPFHASSEDDHDSAISGGSSDIHHYKPEFEVTDEEEHFEDYGEVESDASFSGQENEQLTSKPPLSDTIRPRRDRTRATWTSHRPRRLSCPVAKVSRIGLSSAASATHLLNSANSSRRNSLTEADFYSEGILEITDKVKKLEEKFAVEIRDLSDNQLKSDHKAYKLKEENAVLADRVHMLEDHLQHVEKNAAERLELEERKSRTMVAKVGDLSQELELLNTKYLSMERENIELKSLTDEYNRLNIEKHQIEQELRLTQSELTETEFQLANLQAEHKALLEHTASFDKEREVNGELLDELGKELDELRKYKIENERANRCRSPSITELPSRYKELETQIKSLKTENTCLREESDELQAQLLHNTIEEGKGLLHRNISGKSFADEIGEMSKEKLAEKLTEQQEVNQQLRAYVDRILLTILQKNPSLLEIATAQKSSS
ncbi:rab11 family-interacting protein 4-like isoform X2 [Lineus longissimus]|uniref:rab11 family-interacting protein 4-like isoform X2 n=1 Tax=Lineus longissimus TaxID=88925 RepID=UPI002B4CEB74